MPGKLPVAKIWRSESVTYEGEFVCHDGALYQARRDTAQAPGGTDWVCVARAGKDGINGRTPVLRGTFNARERYQQFDVVTCHDVSYVASHDDPGLPGHDKGWQLIAKGSRGPVGERGERGRKGERGARGEALTIVAWTPDLKNYVAHPTMSDGRAGAPLDLRPFFERFNQEAVLPAIDEAMKDVARS